MGDDDETDNEDEVSFEMPRGVCAFVKQVQVNETAKRRYPHATVTCVALTYLAASGRGKNLKKGAKQKLHKKLQKKNRIQNAAISKFAQHYYYYFYN